jgi:hypothetical protein
MMLNRSTGLAGAQVYGNATLTVTPRKSSYTLGETVQLDFYAPQNVGWWVIQRNWYNGMDTGHNIDGTRGWATYLDRVIGPDGHYRLTQTMGLGNIGQWQWDFQLATTDPNDQLRGGDEHSGLKWMKISGSPWEFSVQGDPRIPAGQDFTSAFINLHPTSKDYKFYVSQKTGQSMDQVLIPKLMIDNRIISDDQPSNYDIAVRNNAPEDANYSKYQANRKSLEEGFARGIVNPFGTSPGLENTSNPDYVDAIIHYRAGLRPIGADGYSLTNATGQALYYGPGDARLLPVPTASTTTQNTVYGQDQTIPAEIANAIRASITGQGSGGPVGGFPSVGASIARGGPAISSAEARRAAGGGVTSTTPVASVTTTAAGAPVSQVQAIAPNSATATPQNSAVAAFQNFTSQISSALPSQLQETVSVAGTSVPYWAIGAAAVAAFFVFSGDRR